jgi:hypothetical protein
MCDLQILFLYVDALVDSERADMCERLLNVFPDNVLLAARSVC